MSDLAPQFEYLEGQLRPTHPALLAEFAAASEWAVKQCNPTLDIAYGPHPRQTFDLFRARGSARGVVPYFHGGYWQSRDKADFRFLAPPLIADGFDVAVVNYPLSPEVGVAGIVDAAEDLFHHLAGGPPVVLVGHSAGGQIVVELGMRAPKSVVGIVAISGVFDLEPLIETTLNHRLALDRDAARAASPIHRVIPGSPPALFAVGSAETAAFQRQTRDMHAAWTQAGNMTSEIAIVGADHFSILQDIADHGPLQRAIVSFVDAAMGG